MLRLFCMSFNGSVNLGKAISLQLCVNLMCTAENVAYLKYITCYINKNNNSSIWFLNFTLTISYLITIPDN